MSSTTRRAVGLARATGAVVAAVLLIAGDKIGCIRQASETNVVARQGRRHLLLDRTGQAVLHPQGDRGAGREARGGAPEASSG